MNSLFENAPAIIDAAKESTLGIVGLMVLAIAILAFLFFYKEKVRVKVGIFLLLLLGVSTFTYSVVLESKSFSTTVETVHLETAIEITQAEPVSEPETEAPPTIVPPTIPVQATRTDCGEHWTGWINAGGGVGSPCPPGCSRGREVGQDYRSVGILPPRPQAKHKFQCWRQ